MRIGLDYRPVTAAPHSGIARQVLAMEQALLSRPGIEVLRFTAAPMGHPHREQAFCPVWSSPAHGLHRPAVRWKFEVKFLPERMRALKPDIYIATANNGLPVAGAGNTRYVLLLHDLFQLTMDNHHSHWLKAMAYRWIDRLSIGYSLSRADAIWTPSLFTASEAVRLFPATASKVSVLPGAVPDMPADLTLSLPFGLPKRYWLVVGMREPRKNIPWFISQWRQARSSDASVPELVAVGSASDLPETLRQSAGLQVISEINDEQLRVLYARAERLWQPSRAEGFGLPVVEALAQAAPVAVARGSALDEVAPAQAARFDPDDSAALRALMLELARNPATSPDESEIFRDWAQKFAMPAYTPRLWALIDGLCEKKAPT